MLSPLPGKLRNAYPDYVGALDSLIANIHSRGEHAGTVVPQALADTGKAVLSAADTLRLSKDEAETVRKLILLAGQTVGIEPGNKGELGLVGVGQTLPDDLLPIVVFDASIRVRDTYRLQETHRGNVVRLPGVEHSYVDTTVHLCKVPVGTDKLADPTYRAKVLSSAADLINGDPGEDYRMDYLLISEGFYKFTLNLAFNYAAHKIPKSTVEVFAYTANVKGEGPPQIGAGFADTDRLKIEDVERLMMSQFYKLSILAQESNRSVLIALPGVKPPQFKHFAENWKRRPDIREELYGEASIIGSERNRPGTRMSPPSDRDKHLFSEASDPFPFDIFVGK